MDYRLARNANIILGICSVGLEAYALHDSLIYREYEKVFLAVTSFYILEAIFFVIWFSSKSAQRWEMGWRALGSMVLFASGGFLIWSTVDIQDNSCDTVAGLRKFRKCQQFEMKLTAASITIVNAIFYLLATSREDPLEGGIVHDQSPVQTPSPSAYQAHYVHSTVPQGASIFVVPRAHLQPMSNSSNYNSPPTTIIGYSNSGHQYQYQSVYPTLSTNQHSAF